MVVLSHVLSVLSVLPRPLATTAGALLMPERLAMEIILNRNPNLKAVYDWAYADGKRRRVYRDVIAFSNKGVPLVIGRDGKLENALTPSSHSRNTFVSIDGIASRIEPWDDEQQ